MYTYLAFYWAPAKENASHYKCKTINGAHEYFQHSNSQLKNQIHRTLSKILAKFEQELQELQVISCSLYEADGSLIFLIAEHYGKVA